MLSFLHIKDFAIIDKLELTFGAGMTVLTGETGAGKSILLDALSLVLGDRADSDAVRHGAEKADISAGFDIRGLPHVQSWLQTQDLAADDECLIRRIVTADGRSKAYINGQPSPLQNLRELGEQLVDIHGQHEHQSLLKPAVQQQLLDDYGDHQQALAATRQHQQAWQRSDAELQKLRGVVGNQAQLDLLRYQVQELSALALGDNELTELEAEHKRLANAKHILGTLQGLEELLLDAEDSVHNRLARGKQQLEAILRYDEGLRPLQELLDNALIQTNEAAALSRSELRALDCDPESLQQIEDRLSSIHELARKHHVRPQELFELQQTLTAQLEDYEQAESKIIALEQQNTQALQAFRQAANTLHQARQNAANKLAKGISNAMQNLNLSGGRFAITLSHDDQAAPSPTGNDHINYEVSANPGQPLKALRKVASGGELSRISLAIQLIVSKQARIPTLIFDEVDAGIGGATATIVGQHLAALGQHCQVLCVTHLAQVAAQAQHHLQISKRVDNKTTRTSVQTLTEDARISEIARMLGGLETSEQSLAHAREMLAASAA